MADIIVSDLTNATTVTNGVSNGTGIFDKLMNTVNLYLNDQYTSGRLKGTDYSTVLLGSMQSVISQSMQYTLQEKVSEAQIDLYNRQKEGFDDDAKQKLLKVLMDSWSVMYSTDPLAEAIPKAIAKENLDKVTENAMIALGINETDNMSAVNAINNVY